MKKQEIKSANELDKAIKKNDKLVLELVKFNGYKRKRNCNTNKQKV